MTRIRIAALAGVLLATAGLLAAWLAGGFGPSAPPAPPAPDDESVAGLPRFEDVAARAGVSFRHFDPATPQHLIAETMGSGVAWIDFDADGWPDLFGVQAGPLPPTRATTLPTQRLYRNNRDGTFADVTEATGLNVATFGTGVAVGDSDNDGFDDLLVTQLGGLTLFRNEPDGRGGRRFADVTAASGLAGTNPHYATSAAWGDLDGDGLLDLYVCNYVALDPANPVVCRDRDKGLTHACSPTMYPAVAHRLYRNLGGGRFQDVSAAAGIGKPTPAAGLAVTILDLDGDGRADVFVANDMYPAYLFHNQTPPGGPIKLVETATFAGCAQGPNGVSMSGMCAEAAEVDGTGRPALFVTNYQAQPNVLFKNTGSMRFVESGGPAGLATDSLTRLGFGAVFLDADLDGNADLAIANGHVARTAPELFKVPYAQEAQLFLGDGRGQFRNASRTAGRDFRAPRVGRGVARGDFDNDGKPDLAVTSVGGPLALLRNSTETTNRWVGLSLAGDGSGSNRSAIGATVAVEAGGLVRTHFVAGGGSYLSASDRRLTLGLAAASKADRVSVRWPSGKVQEYRDLAAGRYWRLEEGQPAK